MTTKRKNIPAIHLITIRNILQGQKGTKQGTDL